MKKITLMSLVASSVLMAGGYNIPENSTNAVALGAANVAHNHNSADAAYYNPAKMVFMSDENHIDANLMYIGLDNVKYDGSVSTATNQHLSSEQESFIVPSFHYVSPKLGDGDTRVGVSVVSPGGLSKRWDDSLATYTAKEFTLETIEINPSVAFKVSPDFSFAVGFRIVHSSGVVKAAGYHPSLDTYSQDMTGDSIDFGYNLALAYQPIEALELALTYRSRIDLTIEGDADLVSTKYTVDGNYAASVSVPLPASLHAAIAYTLPTKTTLEFVYERTYWSAYQNLDFNYTDPTAEALFGKVKPKYWNDTNTYRFGLTQELEKLTLMAGLVFDETPVPDATVGFELPDSDTVAVSLGGRYQINDKMDIGLSGLYSMHANRTVDNDSLDGEFRDGDILIISAGLGYKF